MCGKNKVGSGILEGKSKLSELCLRPLSCCNDLMAAFLKICLILHRCHTSRDGSTIHGIGVKGIFHIIEIFDQLRISEGITDTHARQRSGFGKGLHNKKIVIFLDQRQCGSGSEIHISLIYDHNALRIFCYNLLDLGKRHFHTGRCIGVREYDSAVFAEIIFFPDMELFIQCRTLIRDPEKIGPYIIERIGDIREQDGFL